MPFAIPSSWMWTTLGEISNYGECNNVPVIDITADDWILELEDLEKDTASIIQMLSKKERGIKGVRHKFKKGDVLYSKLRTYLNKVLIAPRTGYCTTEIIPFHSYCGVSTHYLCHVLRSAYFLDYTLQCGYGVKMPRLSTNDACKGMIPLPPLAEQYRIVAEIRKWFSLIDIIEAGKDDLQTIIKHTVNLCHKTRMTSQPRNCLNVSTRKLKSLVITGIMRTYRILGVLQILKVYSQSIPKIKLLMMSLQGLCL